MPGSDGRTYQQEFERRAAFADANLAQDAEKRGSLTDRGMVFILLGAPNWAARKPMRTGDDQDISDGLSTVGSQDAANASAGRPRRRHDVRQARDVERRLQPGPEKPLSARTRTPSRPGTTARSSCRPLPFQEIDFKFLTKQGYGVSVLQRETNTVTAIEAAKTGVKAR